MKREEFMVALQKIGIDYQKCRFVFKKVGLYNTPELWVYPKETGTVGTLVTEETIKDLDYLKEYLRDFLYEPKK